MESGFNSTDGVTPADKRNRASSDVDGTRRQLQQNNNTSKHPMSSGKAETANEELTRLISEKIEKEKIHGMVLVALQTHPDDRTGSQLNVLCRESKKMTAFAKFNPQELRTLWKFLVYKRFSANHRLFEEGDEAFDFYVIWSGQVSARLLSKDHLEKLMDRQTNAPSAVGAENTVHLMNAGDTLGEAVGGGKRKAACVTEQDSELLILDKQGYENTFKIFLEERDIEKRNFLRTVRCFSNPVQWSDDDLLSIARVAQLREYVAFDDVVTQGDQADALFFIRKGLCSVIRTVIKTERNADLILCDAVVTKLCSGEMFGENTVLERGGSAATGFFPSTVQCETKTQCLRLDVAQIPMDKFNNQACCDSLARNAVIYPDDNILLQSFIDRKKDNARTIKVMKEMRKNELKNRGRKTD
jgi:CRP-like cAMP-binding protein